MTKTDDCVCSIIDIAPTISELIDVPLPGANGVVIPEMIDCLQGCDRLILIIVDSLGYSTYQRLNSAMPHVSGNGTVLRCRAVADHTTPAIASILTGCSPETHCILTDDDVCTSPIKSILERVEECGRRSAVVIANGGAKAMRTKINLVAGGGDDSDIIAYDAMIAKHSIDLLRHEPALTVIHIRAIDRYAHEGRSFDELMYAAERIDGLIREICSHAGRGTGVIICGDHPIHGAYAWKGRDVALIAFR